MQGTPGASARSWLCVVTLGMLTGCGRSGASPAESSECQVDADCQQAEQCAEGTCVDVEATGGDGRSGGDVGSSGTASSSGAGGVAIGGAASTCQPGARTCDGPSVRVCGADGISRIETTCSASQVCSQAACHDIACVPHTTFCKDGGVMTCSDDGASSTLTTACSSTQFCVEQAGAADCSDTVCTPGGGLCVDAVATTCKKDGSGPVPGGQDCTAKNLICNAGKCADPTCKPGEKLCQGNDVYLCIGGGTDAVLFSKCNANEVCDPGLLACRAQICTPGKLGCDDTRIATCNDLGTGFDQTGADCKASSQLCVAGECQSQVCTPSTTFCKDGSVYLCDATGLDSALSQTCGAYYHCAPNGANAAYCYYNSCTPGTAVCNGNIATKCNADGSGYDAAGTDCGTDICSAGSCVPKVCEPYNYFCKDGDISYCQNGVSSYLSQDCGADARCLKSNQTIACVPYDCSPGLKACIGNQIGTCADDGTALVSVKQDCNTTSQVCVGASSCADSATDVLGAAEELQSLTSEAVFGDVFDVESNRQLTQLEVNLVLASSRDLRFVVYEAVNGYFIARYDQVVKGVSSSGYASSGAISYTLKAGRRYMLAVAVTGGGAVPYYDALPWQPDASFGRAVGVLATTYATTIYAGYVSPDRLYDFRVTTSLP